MLLLEAGPRDTDFWIHVPLGYGKLFARTDVNWAYESEPEPALNGRRIFTPRGKVLGGSSSINGLVYIRGQREDFDGWGVPGWGFARCCRTSRSPSAQLQGRPTSSATSCATHSSPRRARSASRATPISTALRRKAPATTRPPRTSGRRRSTAVAYLRPAQKRPNLRVETDALATRSCSKANARPELNTGRAERPGAQRYASYSLGRHDQLAAAAAALRRRPARAARAPWHPGGARLAASRRGLQDHFYVRTFWRCRQADHAQRRHDEPVAPGADRPGLPAPQAVRSP